MSESISSVVPDVRRKTASPVIVMGIIALLPMLGGCGQKGPLRLPPAAAAEDTPASGAAPAASTPTRAQP